jgi:hypothetical protein
MKVGIRVTGTNIGENRELTVNNSMRWVTIPCSFIGGYPHLEEPVASIPRPSTGKILAPGFLCSPWYYNPDHNKIFTIAVPPNTTRPRCYSGSTAKIIHMLLEQMVTVYPVFFFFCKTSASL